MVLYHWINYFVAADGSIYKYLRFLTPSFIFITGFLISQVYFSEYETSRLQIPNRLLVRGLKLLGIVLCLNIGLSTLRINSLATRVSNLAPGDMALAYLTGVHAVAFSVLVPIAYLLILSAGLVILSRHYRNVCHIASTAFVTCALLCELKGVGSGYLQVFSIGLLGISVGHISIDRINSVVKRPLALFLAYLTYLSAITLWNDAYLLQIVGVCMSLAVIYWLGDSDPEPGSFRKMLILLGQYSLFAYIAQIVLLQLLRRSLRPLGSSMSAMGIALLASVACTIFSVEILDRVRSRSSGMNKLYAAVFS